MKPGPSPITRNRILLALRKNPGQTSFELRATTAYMNVLVQKGILKVAGTYRSGMRGRPNNLYKLDNRGQAMATNLIKAAKRAAVAA